MQENIYKLERQIETEKENVKELKDEIAQKINQYSHNIEELKITLKKERLTKDEWAKRAAVDETKLNERDKNLLSLEQ